MEHLHPRELCAAAETTWQELSRQIAACPLKTKDRLQIPLQEMPAQDPGERRNNMQEVTHGYSETQAWVEAERCLQCPSAPCVKGCPVAIDIPGFIKKITERNYAESLEIIQESSLLPSICGRVCPQEAQCQLHCTVGKSKRDVFQSVSIGRLERFIADWGAHEQRESPEEAVNDSSSKTQTVAPRVATATGKRVAIIGSGPSSITAAADIRRAGHEVTIFEAFHKPGGVLVYGIPEFRLPKRIVEEEINTLQEMGVEIKTNFLVGRTRTLHDLMEKDHYDAVYIGTGAGLPKFMRIEGENLIGVFAANEYLTRSNLMKAYDHRHADTQSPAPNE